MPVTAGHVPGVTSGLRRIPMDPGRFHSGRWFLLAEGVLVSGFGIAGLISAALDPHAGATGAPVLGLATTPAHSAILLAFGVVAIAAIAKRRAAVTVTALSAIAYFMLLFFSSVATAQAKPTPLGFHAADIVLHGVLGVVNLGLLMWFIPARIRRRGLGATTRPQPRSAAAFGLRSGHRAGGWVSECGFGDEKRTAVHTSGDTRSGGGRSCQPAPASGGS